MSLQNQGFVELGGAVASPSSEGAPGTVELATEAEVDAATGEGVVRAKHLRVKFPAGGSGSLIAGDFSGNARGVSAVDLQAFRQGPAQVASGLKAFTSGNANTASGESSVATGFGNFSSSYYSVTFGFDNVGTNTYACGVGVSNDAFGYGSASFGVDNIASGTDDSAFGSSNTANGGSCGAFGRLCQSLAQNVMTFGMRVKCAVANAMEIGHWGTLTTRSSAIRIHGVLGHVSHTVAKKDTAFTDGGATNGSEANANLMRNAMVFRVHSVTGVLYVDYNDAGTIKTLALGTLL